MKHWHMSWTFGLGPVVVEQEGACLHNLGVQRHVRPQHQADHRAPHKAVVLLWQHLPPIRYSLILNFIPIKFHQPAMVHASSKACLWQAAKLCVPPQARCKALAAILPSEAAGAPQGNCWLACAAAGRPARRACSHSRCCRCRSAPSPHASAPGTRWTPLCQRKHLYFMVWKMECNLLLMLQSFSL